MVRNSLNIENRICFDSDSGSGGSDEDFDQERQQDIAMAAAQRAGAQTTGNYTFSDDFDQGSADNQALIGATSDILAADRLAKSATSGSSLPDAQIRNSFIQEAENLAAQNPNVQAAMNNAMNAAPNLGAPAGNVPAPRFDGANNVLARQRLAQQLAVANAYKTPTIDFKGDYLNNPRNVLTDIQSVLGYNTPKVALDTLQAKAGQFMMPRIDDALQRPGMSPVYGYGGRVTGAANEYGQLIEGTDPMNTLGNDFGGGFSDGQDDSIMPPVDDATEVAGGVTGQIPSDELAINYLRQPYYLYSGFGNQYQPYGYAPTTMVDLLQSRGMTQPQQADTLGLFANPRDFV